MTRSIWDTDEMRGFRSREGLAETSTQRGPEFHVGQGIGPHPSWSCHKARPAKSDAGPRISPNEQKDPRVGDVTHRQKRISWIFLTS